MLDEREFELINIIGPKLGLNQRDISKHMNLSLGMINMLIRRLIAKGFIRIKQLDKKKIEYLLTPKGIAEKMQKSVKYTLKTMNSIGLIKNRLKEVLLKLVDRGERKFVILGESDFSILVEMVLKEICSEEYSLCIVNKISNEGIDGFLLVCKEIDPLVDDLLLIDHVDLVHELAKDYEFISNVTKYSLKGKN